MDNETLVNEEREICTRGTSQGEKSDISYLNSLWQQKTVNLVFDSVIGSTVANKYKIQEFLDEGAMGKVFSACDVTGQ